MSRSKSAAALSALSHHLGHGRVAFDQQVALVALNLHGESLEGHTSQCSTPQSLGPRRTQAGLQAGVDSVTGREMQRLLERKEAAVAEENYDEAKALKAGIERLRLVGSRILELETRSVPDLRRPQKQSFPQFQYAAVHRVHEHCVRNSCFWEIFCL